MKRRHSEKGMALVITLMMLAIVTFMAVVFLSLSRRERTNVKLVEDQATARMMSDIAMDRAKSDMVGTMNNAVEAFLGTATNNTQFGVPADQQHVAVANRAVQRGLLQYDLRTSKNFFNPKGFRRQDGSKPWNVGYYDDFGNWYDDRDKRIASNTQEYYQNIANLQYDPRPPVIVTDGKTNDFRFYIDLNRNGMFDRNGVQKVTGPNNEEYAPNGKFGSGLIGNFVGDPEWIGVLERPDLPHSETNRFIGRYAYLMMPTGKSLDINFIHNLAVFNGSDTNLTYSTTSPRFSRNQGIGSWEMNLAAFLVDLHTNVWRPNQTFYRLTTNSASGQAFKDAVGLMQYRLNYSRGNLLTPRQVFGSNQSITRWGGNTAALSDYVDEAGDGPYVPYNFWYASARPNFDLSKAGVNPDNDQDVRFWHGAERMDRTGEIPDVQRYFKMNSATAPTELLGFYSRFTNAVSNSKTNTYDRYAYYRLLSQMGADSVPAIRGKIHLNFTNEPGTISTNLVPWTMITNNGVAEPTVMLRQPTAVKVVRNDGGEEYQTRTNGLTNFFLIAADAMLRESLVTNIYLDDFEKWRTNYTIGCSYFSDPSLNTVVPRKDPLHRQRYVVATPVRPDISITNIQIFHKLTDATLWRPNDLTYTNNEYDASLHRILQLAANIFDNMTNNAGSRTHRRDDPFFPTVWRPLYSISPTNITITGWEPQFDANFALKAVVTNASLFRSPREYFTNQNVIITNVSFFGQPWVIGVKKGWPNFNEFSIETYAQITRKLEVLKDAPGEKMALTNSGAALANFAKHTRQIFMVGFSNTFGLEAWNSYALTNHRTIRIDAEVEVTFGIDRVTKRDTNNPAIVLQSHPAFANPNVVKLFASSYTIPGASGWPGRQTDMDVTNAIPVNGKSDFRVPIYANAPVFPPTPGIDSWTAREYTDLPPPYGGFFAKPATWQLLNTTPDLRLNVTNRVRYLATDVTENRVLDYVTFDNLVTAVDLDQALHGERNYGNQLAGASGANVVNPSMFWDTTPVQNSNPIDGFTQGIMNQLQVSLGNIGAGQKDWKNYSIFDTTDLQIKDFSDYINGVNTNATIATNVVRQVPFSPTRTFYLQTLYQANDPLVHYMVSDLIDPSMLTRPTPGVPIRNPELGHRNKRRQAIRFDGLHSVSFQDPRVLESDDWQFPIAKIDDPNRTSTYGIENFHYRYPNIGALGQIHRGTPWQTVYLKAGMAPNAVDLTLNTNVPTWYKWAGSYGTHPTNDWRLVGLFTTAMTENAARGLLSVNQSHVAAWSAVLSGVPVITNSIPDNRYRVNPKLPPQFGVPSANYGDLMIEPGSVQLSNIVRNINQYRSTRAMGVFSYMGEILGTPMLSIGANLGNPAILQGSPYLNLSDAQIKDTRGVYDFHALTDEALEAIPARILSLLKEDEPRVTIYCFGQTLKPAPRSFVTSADFYNLCVNYQVTGEYVTKAVVRVEGEFPVTDAAYMNTLSATERQNVLNSRIPLKTVVESFEVLAPFE